MTANNSKGGSAAHASPSVIDDTDSFALRLYKRARNAGPDFEDLAFVVRNLHTVLKHLKVEAEDPESLLNVDDGAVYTRELTRLIEDSGLTLKQLSTILDRHGSHLDGDDGHGSPSKHRTRMDGDRGWTMENAEREKREKIGLIRTKLVNQKLAIDMFLDTIQLHDTSKSWKMVDTSNVDLDSIKDKVDAIATRVCQRESSGLNGDEEELWLQFRDELEREGFSKKVLRKNQDVLRAYIRQLDERAVANGGATPSVRGFLERDSSLQDSNTQMTPYPPYPPQEGINPNMSSPEIDNEKYFPSAKIDRLQSERYFPHAIGVPHESTTLSYEPRLSDDDDVYTSPESMALISTRDLLSLDKRNADLAIAMDNMHLQSAAPPYSNDAGHAISDSPPSSRYLPPSASQPVLFSSSPPTIIPGQTQISPIHVPAVPALPHGNSPSPTLQSHSSPAPNIMSQQLKTAGQPSSTQRPSRLGPDSQGNEIPLDAKWTRIRRSLVSPEVLAQVGVRYEARPDFVAVLGTLTRDQVLEFARRSTEVRNKRTATAAGARKERRPEDRYYPEKYRNWNVETTSARSLPNGGYVINPTGRRRSQFSSASDLFDSSDASSDTDTDHHSKRGGHSRPPVHQSRRQSIPYPHSSRDQHEDTKHGGVKNDSAPEYLIEGDERRTKTYPFIVSAPKESSKESTMSPSATSMPKPILKNKNEDPHVRFDPEPHILDESTSSPRSNQRRHTERDRNRDRDRERDRDKDRDRNRDRSRDRNRSRDRSRDRDKSREKSYHSDRYLERDRHVEHDRRERDRYDRDRDHVKDRRYSTSSSSSRRDRDGRSARKRASTTDTLKAVGIGGAAASLLSVLTEAASGF